MTRAGLLMRLAAFVTVCSVIFAFAGAGVIPGDDPANLEQTPHLITGDTLDNGEPLSFGEWAAAMGGCILLGVFIATDICLSAAQGFGDVLGFEGLTNVGVTFVSGSNAFARAILGFLTFNVPGAPTWFRTMIAVPLNTGLIYILIAIARGI